LDAICEEHLVIRARLQQKSRKEAQQSFVQSCVQTASIAANWFEA